MPVAADISVSFETYCEAPPGLGSAVFVNRLGASCA